MNRTDTNHVYLETTRAAVIGAPQSCNAVVFELINAVSKHQRASGVGGDDSPTKQVIIQPHADYLYFEASPLP